MKKAIVFFSTSLLFVFVSCMPTKTLVDTSCPGYKSPQFSRNDISTGGIAIMPVLGGDEKEQYRRPMGDALFHYLGKHFGINEVTHPQEVIRILNDHGLAEDYSNALRNYQHTGIIAGDLIRNVGEVLEVEFLLYTRFLATRDAEYIIVADSYQRINIDELYVQSQIWCANIGDVVWEGKGGIAVNAGYAHHNIVDLTANGLAEVLGNAPKQGPCEDPRELVRAAQDASTKTYLAALLGTSFLSLLIILAM